MKRELTISKNGSMLFFITLMRPVAGQHSSGSDVSNFSYDLRNSIKERYNLLLVENRVIESGCNVANNVCSST